MKQWEYKVVYVTDERSCKPVNLGELGKQGWEMCGYAWTSFNANAKWFECAPQGNTKDPRFHPTQKPIKLYEWLLYNYAKEGDTILDTHLGSGSSAIAAYDLGFEFTGIEIDNEYYNKATERLQKHIRYITPSLFNE